jgi:hypothetical protein
LPSGAATASAIGWLAPTRLGFSPSVGVANRTIQDATLQMFNNLLVLLPESFRGGCSVGAGFYRSLPDGFYERADYTAGAKPVQLFCF